MLNSMRVDIIFFLLGMLTFNASAQQAIKFASVQQIGVSYNGANMPMDASISAGVRVKQMHYMLGVSFMARPTFSNAYFADVRRNFTRKSNAYFGAQLGATRILQPMQLSDINSAVWSDNNFNATRKPGIYASGIVGYAAPFGRETFYNVSLYYGVHELRYKQTYNLPGKPEQQGTVSLSQLRYGVRLGLSF
jgi:hypothetical protein